MFDLHIIASREALQGNPFREFKGGSSQGTHYLPDEDTIRDMEAVVRVLRENGGQMRIQELYKTMPFTWRRTRRLIDTATNHFPLWEDNGIVGVLDER